MKGRPQDNLEFMQWLKRFYDQHKSTTEKRLSTHRTHNSIVSGSPIAVSDPSSPPPCTS